MTDFFKIVTTTELTTQPNVGGFDFVARVSRSTSSNITKISAVETPAFFSGIIQLQSEWRADISALNDVINWQHKVIDFNSSYSAYLLEQINDEEFEKIAEEMATEEKDLLPEHIAPVMTRLLRLTTLELTPSDFANLFNCPISTVDQALHMIPRFIMEDHPQLQEAIE